MRTLMKFNPQLPHLNPFLLKLRHNLPVFHVLGSSSLVCSTKKINLKKKTRIDISLAFSSYLKVIITFVIYLEKARASAIYSRKHPCINYISEFIHFKNNPFLEALG